MLYTEISFDFKYISNPLISKMKKKKQIKTSRVYVSLEKKVTLTGCCLNDGLNKMNKTRRGAGWLRAAIQLKCKSKFTIKKVLFSTNHKFPPPQDFWSWFNLKHGYKTVNKSSQKTFDPLNRYQRESSCVTVRTNTADTLPIHITTNTSYTQVPGISTTSLPTHDTPPDPSKHTSHRRTTYTHSPPDPYLVEERLYLF